MLLVNDNQPQVFKLYVILKERMGANNNRDSARSQLF